MAIVSNTATTYAIVGNREDLEDTIYRIDPVDTPFRSMLDSVPVTNTWHEWQTQALASPTNNAQLEGDETTFAAVTPTARIGNRTQISRKEVVVSGTQNVMKRTSAGRELAEQLVLKADELKRDIEFVLTNNRAANAGNATTARQLRPLPAWYGTNVDRGSGGGSGGTSSAATDGTQRALTETMLKAMLAKVWTAGGKPSTVMVGPFNKGVISGFAGGATAMIDAEGKRRIATVDVYESDFGAVKIVPNRIQRDRDCHVIDPDFWAFGELRAMQTEELAKTGDAEKRQVITEYTLVARQEAASGVIADLTTS